MLKIPVELPVIDTARLRLRPFTLDDAAEVQRYAGDFDVARMTTSIPFPYEDGMAEQWIGTHKTALASGSELVWAIEHVEDERLVGAIGVTLDQELLAGEVGYWVGKPYWNQGYATEATMAIVVFGFEELGLHRLYARHFTDNPASGRVMEKAGMQYEGTLRHVYRNGDDWRDFAHYSILEDEYAADEYDGI